MLPGTPNPVHLALGKGNPRKQCQGAPELGWGDQRELGSGGASGMKEKAPVQPGDGGAQQQGNMSLGKGQHCGGPTSWLGRLRQHMEGP